MMPAITYSPLVDVSLTSPQPHVRTAPLTRTHLCKHSTDIQPTCMLEITLLPANLFFFLLIIFLQQALFSQQP